ncbi:MAG: hypothetical protein EXS12_01705 [Phycisphaerales bacterium]|nr:hypothetical protein [Phycisphaerales bacterium]
MFATFSILVLACVAAAQTSLPGTLVPVEQGTVDRSVSATSLKIQQVELSQSTNFQKLFGVAGRPDLFVRSQGGLFAVFNQGSYRIAQGKTFIQWPAGMVYYIGQPDFYTLRRSSIRMVQNGSTVPPGMAIQGKTSGADKRIGALPSDNLIQTVPIGLRMLNEPVTDRTPVRVPIKDVGFGHSSAVPELPHVAEVTAPPQAATALPQTPAAQSTHSAKNAAAPSPPKP